MQSFVTTLCNFCRRNFCVEIYFIMEYSIGSNVKKKKNHEDSNEVLNISFF